MKQLLFKYFKTVFKENLRPFNKRRKLDLNEQETLDNENNYEMLALLYSAYFYTYLKGFMLMAKNTNRTSTQEVFFAKSGTSIGRLCFSSRFCWKLDE